MLEYFWLNLFDFIMQSPTKSEKSWFEEKRTLSASCPESILSTSGGIDRRGHSHMKYSLTGRCDWVYETGGKYVWYMGNVEHFKMGTCGCSGLLPFSSCLSISELWNRKSRKQSMAWLTGWCVVHCCINELPLPTREKKERSICLVVEVGELSWLH